MARKKKIQKKAKKVPFMQRLLGRGDRYDEFEEFDEVDGNTQDNYEEEEYDDEIDNEMLDENEREMQQVGDITDDDLQINLVDKGNTLVAQAIVPGLSEEEIDVNLNREMLTIRTQSNDHHLEKDGNYLYEEVSFGSFSRSILLPAEIEVDDSKAEVQDGVLKITMPKIDKTTHKKINVKKK